jgi:predicted transcriptional regulator of viral defense system
MSKPAGIGSQGRAELTRVLGSGRRLVTPADVVTALDVDAGAAAKRLSRWAADGWLRRVRRGLYIPVPVDVANPATWSEHALIVAAAIWEPCYFTGWTAANHWALTEQVFRTTILKTAARVRSSSAHALDHDYIVSHASADHFDWGLKNEWRDEVRLRFADPARTVIEVLDSPHLGGGIRHGAEILTSYLDDHPASTLVGYGDRLGNRAVFKRLGYLVEVLGLPYEDLVIACRGRLSSGVSLLDPAGPDEGRRSSRWGLRINVPVAREGPS